MKKVQIQYTIPLCQELISYSHKTQWSLDTYHCTNDTNRTVQASNACSWLKRANQSKNKLKRIIKEDRKIQIKIRSTL